MMRLTFLKDLSGCSVELMKEETGWEPGDKFGSCGNNSVERHDSKD